MKLVIVESPTKAKTLKGILGSQYLVEASMGHIRDLPKSGLGVDVANNFEPQYEIPEKATKTINELKKLSKDSDEVVLATDPDREGEAISWHLKEILAPKRKAKGTKYPSFSRVVFHELTKPAIEEAFSHPGELNVDLVDAQQARRVLDRLVGYKLSPLLWKKVRYGLSAGRVQSVAVRLVVERERERQAFKPEEYWSVKGNFESLDHKRKIQAELNSYKGKKISITNETDAKSTEQALLSDTFKISEIKKSERKKNPYQPFKTSTLQQAMSNVYGFTAKRTMNAAQGLFEKGIITYHRTDSLNLSPQFIEAARGYIKDAFGKQYLPAEGIMYKTKSANAQEAHEAIRPTLLTRIPEEKNGMAADELKVYTLIWKRSIECQMLPAIYDQTSITISSSKEYDFKASGSVVKFDGWLVVGKKLSVTEEEDELNVLPDFSEAENVNLLELKPEQHFTQPPARYSDATLIKTLEELGVGRPSTYAPTIATIQARGYVTKEGKYFMPADVAYVVNDLLVEHFPEIVDYKFTAQMEDELDEVANGEKEWVPVVRDFYIPFEKTIAEKDKTLKKTEVTNLGESGENCPECGKPLVFKLGKFGKFLSCSGYPDCKFAKPVVETIALDSSGAGADGSQNGEAPQDYGKCDKCEDGVMILKTGRFGKFIACSNYPKCKNTKPFLQKIGVKCPKCVDGDVVVKKAKRKIFYGCSRYPECDFSSWTKPVVETITSAKTE